MTNITKATILGILLATLIISYIVFLHVEICKLRTVISNMNTTTEIEFPNLPEIKGKDGKNLYFFEKGK